MKSRTPLSELMTADLYTVDEYDTMEAVARIFSRHEIHHVPVINEKKELAGIISKSDFLKISLGMSLFSEPEENEYNSALYNTTLVRDVMSKIVVCLEPKDTAEVAARIFMENLFHALPICENGKLVGIVTTYDLINFAFKKERQGLA